MSTLEIFNQDRMDRCANIQREIMENWQKTNSFNYTVRATQAVEGLTLAELRTHYFSVGVGNKLTDVPFTDLLVIFSMIEQECASLKNRKDKAATEFTIEYQITTDWPEHEAVRLLSQIRIEIPFDKGTHLRIVEAHEPRLGPDDDPQT